MLVCGFENNKMRRARVVLAFSVVPTCPQLPRRTSPVSSPGRAGGLDFVPVCGKVARIYRFGVVLKCVCPFVPTPPLSCHRVGISLPKLPPKKYLARSNIHQVAITRRPHLQGFINAAIAESDMVVVQTLIFFLTPTTKDESTAATSAIRNVAGGYVSEEFDSDDEDAKMMMAMKVTPAGLKGTANADHTGAMPGEITVAAGEALTIWPPLDSSYVMVSTEDGTRGMLSTSLVTLDPGEGAVLPEAPQRAKTVAEEIVMTERGFCQQLVQVRDVFFKQLRTIITAPEAKTLFGNWSELVVHSEQLSAALDAATENGESIPAALAKGLPALGKSYQKYCSGIPAAQDLYSKKMEEKPFIAFEQSFPDLNKPTLNHFMRPVQRVMKYPLLISELKKQADKAIAKAGGGEIDADILLALDIASELAIAANATMAAPQESLSAALISRPQSGTFAHTAKAGGVGGTLSQARARCSYIAETRVCRHISIDGSKYCQMHTCENEDCNKKKSSRQVFCPTCQNGSVGRARTIRKAKSRGPRALYEAFQPVDGGEDGVNEPPMSGGAPADQDDDMYVAWTPPAQANAVKPDRVPEQGMYIETEPPAAEAPALPSAPPPPQLRRPPRGSQRPPSGSQAGAFDKSRPPPPPPTGASSSSPTPGIGKGRGQPPPPSAKGRGPPPPPSAKGRGPPPPPSSSAKPSATPEPTSPKPPPPSPPSTASKPKPPPSGALKPKPPMPAKPQRPSTRKPSMPDSKPVLPTKPKPKLAAKPKPALKKKPDAYVNTPS